MNLKLTPIALATTALLLSACNGAAQFASNFKAQITKEVDPQPIQQWLQKQSPSPNYTNLSPAFWPPEIKRLNPDRVDLWKDQGVTLTWGKVGHDGDRRQIYIARDPNTAPPPDVLWIDNTMLHDAWTPIKDHWPGDWQPLKPGIWCWLLTPA